MKKTLKKLIFRFLATACRNDGPKVVYYHDVGTEHTSMGTPVKLFRAHFEAAREKGFMFKETIEELTGTRQLLLCFDDGFRGIWDERSWFVSAELHPTIFIAVDLVGNHGYLTWDEIFRLQAQGFHFQSHTWSHRPLTEVPSGEWKHELEDSRRELSNRLGRTVDSLCFPCGLFSSAIVDAAVSAGYRHLFASFPGCVDPHGVLVPRNLTQFVDSSSFLDILHGAMIPLKGYYLHRHCTKDGASIGEC